MVIEFWIGNHITKVQNKFFSNIIKNKYGSSFVLKNIQEELSFFNICMSDLIYDPNTFSPCRKLFFDKKKENVSVGYIYVTDDLQLILDDIDLIFEKSLMKKVIAKWRLNQL